MKKTHTNFVCQECGYRSPKWLGRCPACGSWDSLVEEKPVTHKNYFKEIPNPIPLTNFIFHEDERVSTGLAEFDQVLGGGIVKGSIVLIGGDPGIGKSTLLLQVLSNLASSGYIVVYLSAEESIQQVKIRAARLGVENEKLFVLSETNLDIAIESIERLNPRFLVVDSIQTVYLPELSSAPGSVAQVRECTARLLRVAKTKELTIFLVGHVTKEGAIAGPRVLEHLVDTVLYFEGERGANFRILRAVKNRFGSTNEIGVFEMTSLGLVPLANPSELFLSRTTLDAPGSVVVATIEGTRPILVEVQALVTNTPLTMPRRTSVGFDPHRLAMLAAILEKRAGLAFYDRDIYLNVVGGLKLAEPGADLGVVLALASSRLEKALPKQTIVFGEVGLTGEIRPVSQADIRVKEAAKMGFQLAYLPQENMEGLKDKFSIKLIGVSNLQDTIEMIF